MKKVLFIPLLLIFYSTFAQNINSAEDLLYYGKFESAENLLNQVIKNDHQNAEAWYLLSVVPGNRDDQVEFKSALLNASTNIKDDPYYLVAIGKIFLDESNVQEAEKYFEQSL